MMHIVLMFFSLLLLNGCQNKYPSLDNLDDIKKDFILSIMKENYEESPFHINYNFRTVFFSKDLISLMGEIFVYDHFPHGWTYYETKTYIKINGKFKEITLNDLFTTSNQKAFLRIYCENVLKKDVCSYFSGKDPLCQNLDPKLINNFIVDDQFLIIIFQSYRVAGGYDGPVHIKIPYPELKNKWDSKNPLIPALNKAILSKRFTSSWNEKNY